MKTKIYPRLLALAAVLILAGCASKPKAPATLPEAEGSSIQAEAAGLAPSGAERFKTIGFALYFGGGESVTAWSASILGSKGGQELRKLGGGTGAPPLVLPDALSWDGRDDSGALAPEGTYSARLTVEYGGKFKPSRTASKSFVLALSPPVPSFSPNPAQFAYVPEGAPKPVSVVVAAKGGVAKLDEWEIAVYDAAGSQVKALSGPMSAPKATWDGSIDGGGYVKTAAAYPAVLTVADEFGNVGTFRGEFSAADVPSAGPCSIETHRVGFSPMSQSVKNTLSLYVNVGSKAKLKAWQVQVSAVEKGNAVPVRTYRGSASDLPESIGWDGKDDSGRLAAEGSYFASLDLDYGKDYKPARARSRSFSLVTTAPTGSITVDPPTADLSDLGPKNPVDLTVQAKSAYAQIASWVMAAYDESGVSVAVWSANWPKNKVSWDGRTVEGGLIVPGMRYKVVAKVQDEYGNVGSLKGGLAVAGLTPPTEPSSIEASSGGLAPTGDGSHPSIAFNISAGDAESVEAWEVGIVSENNVVEKTFKGAGKQVPKRLEWDGRIDDGSFAPEGRYSAMLTLSYGATYAPALVESKRFVLDLTPPTGKITLSPSLFSPDGDGENDVETITVAGEASLGKIVGWNLTAYDPGNSPFATWKGAWLPEPIAWDGKGSDGSLVESASDYPLVLKIRDEFGNVGVAKSSLATDILALISGGGYRIRISSIVFKGYTDDYRDLPPALAARNLETLDLLAAKLKLPRFVDYKVKLEGHAVMINWDDEQKGRGEQSAILVPLSKARAEAIKAALMERGMSGDRLMTEGLGAANPIVPDSDYVNRWKNRRVEFYLMK